MAEKTGIETENAVLRHRIFLPLISVLRYRL